MKRIFLLISIGFLLISIGLVFVFSGRANKSSDTALAPTKNREEIIVVSERDKNETLQLFIRNIDGSNPTQLTFNKKKSWMPAISPCGKKAAYVVDAKTSLNLYQINLDGSENKQLTFGGLNIVPCWTPDGKHLLYSHSPAPHKTPVRIYKMDADGKNKKMLLDKKGKYWEMVPTISPDGKQVAFTSNRSGDGKYEIWKVNMDGSNLTRLTTVAYDDDIKANIQQKVPAWSPDGSRIALWRGVEMTELAKDGGERDRKIFQSWKVCVMHSDGTDLTVVDFGDDPAWSNDGKHLLYADPINRDKNRPGVISVKIHSSAGGKNRTLFRTRKDFGRMAVGFRNK